MLMAGQPKGEQLYPHHRVLFNEAGLFSLGLSAVLCGAGGGLAAMVAGSNLSCLATF